MNRILVAVLLLASAGCSLIKARPSAPTLLPTFSFSLADDDSRVCFQIAPVYYTEYRGASTCLSVRELRQLVAVRTVAN